MWFGIITLFPEMFAALESGITGRAIKHELLELTYWNPRDFTSDKHQTVDAKPYGGGPGMVMMAQPLLAAIAAAKTAAPSAPRVIYLSPQGRVFSQTSAEALQANNQPIIFLAGRYEGIDERVIEQAVDEEWSIGDYILTGGELAAMVMIDAMTRLIPGAVGDEDSVSQDSLSSGLLKYPQYTRPEQLNTSSVPEILLSGNHPEIARWRRQQALGRTWQKRPELLPKIDPETKDGQLLAEFIEENEKNE